MAKKKSSKKSSKTEMVKALDGLTGKEVSRPRDPEPAAPAPADGIEPGDGKIRVAKGRAITTFLGMLLEGEEVTLDHLNRNDHETAEKMMAAHLESGVLVQA